MPVLKQKARTAGVIIGCECAAHVCVRASQTLPATSHLVQALEDSLPASGGEIQ
jgi:hypothetical protein